MGYKSWNQISCVDLEDFCIHGYITIITRFNCTQVNKQPRFSATITCLNFFPEALLNSCRWDLKVPNSSKCTQRPYDHKQLQLWPTNLSASQWLHQRRWRWRPDISGWCFCSYFLIFTPGPLEDSQSLWLKLGRYLIVFDPLTFVLDQWKHPWQMLSQWSVFNKYFSNGLKPPTRSESGWILCNP